ncbi:hypothetical protein ACFLU6_06995 [Acidobacteriota bacterium]
MACDYYFKNDIGVHYAALRDRTILTQDVSTLSEDERVFRESLLAFEDHYFECEECTGRLRDDQEVRLAFNSLTQSGRKRQREARTQERTESTGGQKRTLRWLPLAASILLFSVIALTFWIGKLTNRIHTLEAPGEPETLASLIILQPAVEGARSYNNVNIGLETAEQPFILAVDIPKERSSSKYTLSLLDVDGRILWRKAHVSPDPSSRIMVHVKRRFLEPGSYDLQIRDEHRPDNEEGEAVAYFPFQVVVEE